MSLAIDILARHPSTAKFISKELAQRFVADDPPQALVDRMADTFTKTGRRPPSRDANDVYLAGIPVRRRLAIEIEVTAGNGGQRGTGTLGRRRRHHRACAEEDCRYRRTALYGKARTNGLFPNTSEAWSNTAGLLGRINFATALTSNQISGVKVEVSRFNYKNPSMVAAELLAMTPSPSMLSAIEKGIHGKEATPSILTSLVMSSPDFQKR